MPKRMTYGHFLTSSEDKLFFVKKEDVSFKRRTYRYGKPIVGLHEKIKQSVTRLIHRLKTTVKSKTFNSYNALNYVHVQVGSDWLTALYIRSKLSNHFGYY